MWSGFVGQSGWKARTEINIAMSKKTGRKFPNTLLTGPAGSGKTTGARIVSQMLEVPFFEALPNTSLDDAISHIEAKWSNGRGVLFIDELPEWKRADIARIRPLTDQRMTFPRKKVGDIALPNLTVFAATTEPERLKDDDKSRFDVQRFSRLSTEEVEILISSRNLESYKYKTPGDTISSVAPLCYGNGRRAVKFAEYAYSLFCAGEKVTADRVLWMAQLTKNGVSEFAEEYIIALWKLGEGKAVKGGHIASDLGIEMRELEDVERELARLGMLMVETGYGRQLVDTGRELARKLVGLL